MLVWLLNLVVTHWFATTVLGLPRIQSRIQSRICSKDNSRLIQYKVKVIFFSKTGMRAAPFIRQTAKNYWSHDSFAFVLWNLYAFQQAIELWKTNMRHPQASEVVNKDIISHFFIAEPKKNTRGPNQMLKELQLVRMSASLIKIAYDERHRGAVSSQQHNSVEFLSYAVGELGKNSGGDEDPGARQLGEFNYNIY
ncbi:hypothetical protein DVH24_029414 [Malus domestica]|uniref:Uncharacterized protein n=1 Tax=Malus domestica TaxID=3750 RepID=A0A498I0P4_MALDO|nr:hypothetical protein DVH24_029414 [Malus domestica]